MTYAFHDVKSFFQNSAYGGFNPSDHQCRDALGPTRPDFPPDLVSKPKPLLASGDVDAETPAPIGMTSSPSRRRGGAGIFIPKFGGHSCSWMNVVFVLKNSEIGKGFIDEGNKLGLCLFQGHSPVDAAPALPLTQ